MRAFLLVAQHTPGERAGQVAKVFFGIVFGILGFAAFLALLYGILWSALWVLGQLGHAGRLSGCLLALFLASIALALIGYIYDNEALGVGIALFVVYIIALGFSVASGMIDKD